MHGQHMEAYTLGVSDPSQAPASGTDEYRRLEERDGVISSRVLSGLALRVAWLWPPGRPKLVEALRQLGLLGTAPG